MANIRKINNPSADFFPEEGNDSRFHRRVDPNAFPSQSDAANANERGRIWVEPDIDRMSDEERNEVWARYSDNSAGEPHFERDSQEAAWSKYENEASSGSMFDAQGAASARRSKKGPWLTGAAALIVVAGLAIAVAANNSRAPQRPSSTMEQALNSGAAGIAGAASMDPMNTQMARDLANSEAAQSGMSGGARAAVAPIETAATAPLAAKPVAKAKAAPAEAPLAKSSTVDRTADDDLKGALPPTYWQGAPNPPAQSTAPPQQSPIGSAPPATAPATPPGALNLTPAPETPPQVEAQAPESASVPEPAPQ